MDGWEGDERRPRPAPVVGAVLLGLVVLASLVRSGAVDAGSDPAAAGALDVVAGEVEPRTPVARASPPAPAAVDGAVGAWTPLPEAPIAGRDRHVDVWTGTELVVWGGISDPEDANGLARRVLHADGAAYDPARRSWRPIAASPLSPRERATAAWTGAEVVVVAGRDDSGALADAAAYDPATDTWRLLPPPRLDPRASPGAAWTGTQLLVHGGTDLLGPLADGATYEPATNAWVPVPPAPFPVGGVELDVEAAGRGAVAAGLEVDPDAVAAAGYDSGTRSWSALPPLPEGRRQVLGLVDAGDAVLGLTPVLQSGCCAELVELGDGATAWQVRSPSPLAASSATAAVWAVTGYLIPPDGASPGAYWHAATGEWSTVPGVLGLGRESTATWAGDRLLMWGANDSDGPDGVELVIEPAP